MSEPFRPLQPQVGSADTSGAAFRVKLVAAATDGQACPAVRLPTLSGLAGHQHASSSSVDEPKVNVVREGDRISRIEIQCTCGQMIELTCQY